LDPINFLIEFLEIYSPTGEEERASMFLYRKMQEFGFETRIDQVGNVIGKIGDGKPAILLCGHIDTVPGFITVRQVGDEIFGRGAVDAKGPLAAMIMAARDFVREKIKGMVIVAGVVDEEGASRGIKNIIASGLEADYAVFGEPSNARNVVIGYKGRIHFILKVKTRASHPASPAAHNASEEMINAWNRIRSVLVKEGGGKLRSPSCSIISIKGDLTEAEMEVSIRVPFGITWREVFNVVNLVINEVDKEVECQLELIDAVDPYESNKGSPLIEVFRKAINDVFGEEAKLLRKTGTGDMNYYGNWLRAGDAVTYGPGDPRFDHTKEERIRVEEYLGAIEVLRRVIRSVIS